MSERKDGGPAFPVPTDDYAPGRSGMSLRDWFAGQALMGWVSDPEIGGFDQDKIAAACYELADAFLAEREKGAK